jgi:hypothetical protein
MMEEKKKDSVVKQNVCERERGGDQERVREKRKERKKERERVYEIKRISATH